jgi:hypothetical protein
MYAVSIVQYPVSEFPFRDRLCEHFRSAISLSTLEALHECIPDWWLPSPDITPANDQSSECHRFAYQIFEGDQTEQGFLGIYRRFVKFVLAGKMEAFLVQRRPTIRLQFPGSVAVGSTHRDSEFGHLRTTQNCWLPLTALDQTSTIWIDVENNGVLRPVMPTLGEYIEFCGNLLHGNVENRTLETRVSLDFRIIHREYARSSPLARSRFSDIPLFNQTDGRSSYFVEPSLI